jgi:ATP-dependent helicase/nuclease subunit A
MAGGVASAPFRAGIVGDALAVLEDARFADLFGPDALAEAPVTAVVGDGIVISGTVDRLLVEETRVRVVDFKTGRRAPAGIGDVPPYHLRQMAAYVAALEKVFPGRRIEAALLYTAGPVLIPLDARVIADHKPGFVAAQASLPPGG